MPRRDRQPDSNIAAETAYISRFFITQCPSTLSYVARLRGLKPPRATETFTYCDLGCGSGLTVNVLAAAMPQARFYGIDLSREHIDTAQRVAQSGKLTNATFICGDFAGLAARDDLPRFDFITLQGVYSWVDRETRTRILQAVKAMLKPAGLLYVSYNALPGWAPFLPIRETLRMLVGRTTGTPGERATAAFRYINEIAERAPYFAANPVARKLLDEVRREKRGYLIHEFLAGAWDLFTFDQVAEDMASIGLGYCGSALLESNSDNGGLAAELRPAVKAIAEPIGAETMRSFLKNERYRADIFTAARPQKGWLGQWDDFKDEIFGPPSCSARQPVVQAGELAELARAFFAITRASAVRLSDIRAMPPFADADDAAILRVAHSAVRTLARRPYAFPTLDRDEIPERIRMTLPIHAITLSMAETEGRVALPSPILGTGIILPFATAFILEAACQSGVANACEPAVRRLLASERVWVHNGRNLETEEEIRPAMAEVHADFRTNWLPFLLRIGTVEPA